MVERKEENVRDYFGDMKIRILTYLFLLLKSLLLSWWDGMEWNKNGLNIEHTSQLR